MRGMPFSLQGKGGVQIAAEELGSGLWCSGVKKEAIEPRSVLDHRRSRSPPTSTSTLSSSLGGGGGSGSTDTAGVAAVSDNPPHRWLPSSQDVSSSAAEAEEGGRKEEWASELQPIPQEIGFAGGDKCGLGVEDWENMLSETPVVADSPGHDRSFLKWIMGDVEDPSSIVSKQQLPQHQQLMFPQGSLSILGDFDGGGVSIGGGVGSFGFLDSIFGCDPIGGVGGVTSAEAASLGSSGSVTSCGGFPFPSSNNNNCNSSGGDTRALQIPPNLSSLRSANIASSCGGNPNPNFPLVPPATTNLALPLSLPPSMLFQEPMEEKPQLFSSSLSLNPHQSQRPHNPSLFQPFAPSEHQQISILLPPAKRHHSMTDSSCAQVGPGHPFTDGTGGGHDLFLRRHHPQLQQHAFGGLPVNPFLNLQQKPMKPKIAAEEVAATAAHHQQHQALIDQLTKAAELLEAGNSSNARGILARLNHQLSSPIGKPFIRSAFYFKEALAAIVSSNLNASPSAPPTLLWKPPATPLDVVLKISAYKAYSEISPVVQFTNFTCIQVLLEELKGCDRIHIVDFDIGVGSQWSSLMQELAQRRCSSVNVSVMSLKITALVSPSSHHPLELILTRDNLSQFAGELNIPFEFNVMPMDSFDPSTLTMSSMGNEAIAVNIPVGSSYTLTPLLLRLVKQLSPRIVVSVDHGCDCSDLTFSKHFINSLQSITVLLDSMDASGTSSEVVGKIERLLLQPRIESSVLRRYLTADKILPWRTLFASSGFVPVPFSNFTETQAECLLKRIQVRGFQVEKHQSSLLLCWTRGELVSVSAWRC